MNETPSSNIVDKSNNPRKGLTGGIVLILIGLGLLIMQFIDLPGLFALLLGAGFLIAGVLTHKGGLIIPGGIISGVGLGFLAVSNNPLSMAEPATGGLFLVCFSLGWYLITLLTALFTCKTAWWALIPGGFLTLTGGLVMWGEQGVNILRLIGMYWPAILVLIGILILVQYFRKSNES